MKEIKIGILGFGTIGSGVKKVLEQKNIHNVKIEKIFDRPINKEKIGEAFTDSAYDIVRNPDIDVVIETMGGLNYPAELIRVALENKKHVITANKEVVSVYLKEFLELSKKNNVSFLFEASSGGGIPLIYPLIENSKANDINAIYGILNGTTNYIITRLLEGMNFNDALKMAQEKGFAEADPTNDLEGLDMVRKIAILSDICYDTFINIDDIYHYGIRNLTKEFIDKAKEDNYIVKFVAKSEKKEKLNIAIEPVLVKKESLLASASDEYNIVIVEGKTNGRLAFYGKGAGSLPTATAIVTDIIKVVEGSYKFNQRLEKVFEIENDKSGLYLVETIKGEYKYTNELDNNIKFYAKVLEV